MVQYKLLYATILIKYDWRYNMQILQLDTQLSKMPLSEKFLMMERLWENLSQDADDKGFTPKWHIDVLDDRALKVENGESNFNSFSDVKKRLQTFVDKY